jgi:hemoglobin
MTDLVEDLGGRAVLDQVIEDFYVRVQNDPLLAPIFATADIDRLVSMQQEFLSAALRGEGERSSTSLRDAHAGRAISPRHFSRFVEHFVAALEDHDADPDAIRAVTVHLGLYADDVVGASAEAG